MKTIVIGAGPAGMMAAIQSAKNGNEVLLIEKNKQMGKKLLMSGNGRCNVTNNCDVENFLLRVHTNPKFLYSALHAFSPTDMLVFLKENGCLTKEEDHHRMFPTTDKASSVLDVLANLLYQYKVNVHCDETVSSLLIKDTTCIGVQTNKDTYYGDKIILCTGGKSYPITGSCGDGYTLAKQCGHTIQDCKPALVALTIEEDWLKDLKGLALKNVELKWKKKKYRGDILFTHFGISGPMILNVSSLLERDTIYFNLLPDEVDLNKKLVDYFNKYPNKQIQSVLSLLFPTRFVNELLDQLYIDTNTPSHSITKEERLKLVHIIQQFPITITGTQGFDYAMVTKGGISVKELNPNTMESKRVKNLYFAGEIIDVDAQTGGFNLQIAWATGYVAGN